MSTVTKSEMDMKAIKTNNNSLISLIVDFNNIIKRKEEWITQFKDRKTHLLKNGPIPDINRKRKLNDIYDNSRKKDKIDGNILNKKIKVIDEIYNTPDDYATNIEKTPPTEIYLTGDAAMFSSVTSSTILECNIKDDDGGTISSGKNKYTKILVDILKKMDPTTIINNSKFKFKLTNKYGRYGYILDPCLKLSIQTKGANETFKEIIRLVKLNKYTIQISIKLESGDIIHLNKLSPGPY
jgi:hypothetical protein